MSDGVLAYLQRVLWCSRRIDERPIDRADMVVFLKRRDFGCGIGRVVFAASNAMLSRRKVSLEIETDEPYVQLARVVADEGSFGLVGKYGVDHNRMTL